MSIQRVIHIAANQRSPGAGAGRGVGGRIINKRHCPAKKKKKNGRKGCGGGGEGAAPHHRGHSASRSAPLGWRWAPQTPVGQSPLPLAHGAALPGPGATPALTHACRYAALVAPSLALTLSNTCGNSVPVRPQGHPAGPQPACMAPAHTRWARGLHVYPTGHCMDQRAPRSCHRAPSSAEGPAPIPLDPSVPWSRAPRRARSR